MIYKCNECGLVFNEFNVEKDGGGDIGEDWNVCPECGSDSFEEGSVCIECGEFSSDFELCDDCLDEMPIEIFFEYVNEYKIEKEFFVEWWFSSECESASVELIAICKENWADAFRNPITRDVAEQSLKNFVIEDKSHFIDWYKQKHCY